MSEIQSVQRAFEILEAVAQVSNGAQLGDIAKLTGLPKSTISRMLTTLEKIGAVQRKNRGDGFRIGPTIAQLISQPSWLVSLGEGPLQWLVDQTGATATLSIMDGDRLLYIAQKGDPNSNIQLRDWTGIHFPTLHVLSPGKLFLAYNRALQTRYLAKPLERFTKYTVVDPNELKNILNQIYEQGYAWVREEFERGLAGVSAPIFDRSGNIVAALSLYGPVFQVPHPEYEKEFSDLVSQQAAEMSAKLTGENK